MMIPEGTFDTSVEGHFSNDEFVFFWSGPFSNWYPSPFTTNIIDLYGNDQVVTVNCAEQAMMLWKAALHGDLQSWDKIMKTKDPAKQKKLGRQVTNFNDELWKLKRLELAEIYLYDKYNQNPQLKQILLDSGTRTLVEASPFDAVWGIKMGMNHYPDILNPALWQGENLLGVALMNVRARLREEYYVK